MKERGLSKDEAFMVETAAAAEILAQHKSKKEKHKAAFGECFFAATWGIVFCVGRLIPGRLAFFACVFQSYRCVPRTDLTSRVSARRICMFCHALGKSACGCTCF